MSLTDIDPYYIKCITSLHSDEHLKSKEPSYLQIKLEEAIKNKTGIVKDFTALVAISSNRPQEEIRNSNHCIEENKTTSSSDNELELDLFNEDLMCIICNGMDVAARNRLLECCECHSLYHQECHRPPVTTFEPDNTWTCQNCKDASKKMKKSTPGSSPSHAANTSQTSSTKPAKSSPPHSHRSSSSSTSGSIKLSVSKSSSSTFKTSSKSNTSQSSSKNTLTPNMLSADKRLQIMKKKAAKLQEKRKQTSR